MVTVKEMGALTEVTYNKNKNTKAHVLKISNEEYVHLGTGEVKEFQHKAIVRSESPHSVRRTMHRIRELITTNIVDPHKARFCTLTYRELMTNRDQLYQDFRKFNQRFQRYLLRNNMEKAEYISIAEPQGRGAWHLHCIYIWENKAPFIPNDTFADIWGHGFTKIRALDNIDNVASYLVAYLSDMELPEEYTHFYYDRELRYVEIEGKKKSFVKGQRLGMYPSGFNIVRHSKGIKYPNSREMPLEDAMQLVKGKKETYHAAYRLSDETSGYETVIIKNEYKNIVGKIGEN